MAFLGDQFAALYDRIIRLNVIDARAALLLLTDRHAEAVSGVLDRLAADKPGLDLGGS